MPSILFLVLCFCSSFLFMFLLVGMVHVFLKRGGLLLVNSILEPSSGNLNLEKNLPPVLMSDIGTTLRSYQKVCFVVDVLQGPALVFVRDQRDLICLRRIVIRCEREWMLHGT